jgi:uncharacterized protein
MRNMQNIFILLFLVCVENTYCQEYSPPRFGRYIMHYYNGQHEEIQYFNGNKNGLSIKYYRNGSICKKCRYTTGKLNGFFEEYYNNGRIYCKGHYKNDLKTGIWTYRHRNGKLNRVEHFKEGRPESTFTWYFTDSIIRKQVLYRDDKKVRETEYYLMPGNKIALIKYINKPIVVNDFPDSTYEYFESGKIKSIKRSFRDYQETQWNESGIRLFESYSRRPDSIFRFTWYPNGLPHEKLIRKSIHEVLSSAYYDNGKLIFERYHPSETSDGYDRTWDSAGILRSEILYRKGWIQWSREWAHGILLKESKYNNGILDSINREWYPDGKIKSIYKFEKGKIAKKEEWNASGIKIYEINNDPDYEKFWYENGILSKESWSRSPLEKTILEYYPDGTLKQWVWENLPHGPLYEAYWFDNGMLQFIGKRVSHAYSTDNSSYSSWVFHGQCQEWFRNGEKSKDYVYNYDIIQYGKEWNEKGVLIAKQIHKQNYSLDIYYTDDGKIRELTEIKNGKQVRNFTDTTVAGELPMPQPEYFEMVTIKDEEPQYYDGLPALEIKLSSYLKNLPQFDELLQACDSEEEAVSGTAEYRFYILANGEVSKVIPDQGISPIFDVLICDFLRSQGWWMPKKVQGKAEPAEIIFRFKYNWEN